MYCIPFGVETYGPVTRKSIEADSFFKLTVAASADKDYLLRSLSSGPEDKFDEGRVRFLIVTGAHRYYLDARAVVVIDGGTKGIQIDAQKIRAFVKWKQRENEGASATASKPTDSSPASPEHR